MSGAPKAMPSTTATARKPSIAVCTGVVERTPLAPPGGVRRATQGGGGDDERGPAEREQRRHPVRDDVRRRHEDLDGDDEGEAELRTGARRQT